MKGKHTLNISYVIIFITILLYFLFDIIPITAHANREENFDENQMPFVMIGGESVIINYTNESFVFASDVDYSELPDVGDMGDNIIQIGNIPIISPYDLEVAFKVYNEKRVPVKRAYNGKIYSKYEVISNRYFPDTSDYIEYNYICGKVCFWDSTYNRGYLLAHPASYGKIAGTVYEAFTTGINDEAYFLDFDFVTNDNNEKNIIGYINSQDTYGTLFSYAPNKINFENHKQIQIAKKEEVTLGKAYLYMDYGEGLNYYEVTITSLVDDETHEQVSQAIFYDYAPNNSPISSNRFIFTITDERLINSNITELVPGMSGTPIIQNDKLIGFAGYTLYGSEIAIYADSTYYSFIEHVTQKEKVIPPENPKVILGKTPAIAYIKNFGLVVNEISDESIGIKANDLVIAIDGLPIYYGLVLQDIINNYNYDEDALKLTILRENEIIDINISQKPDITIKNYAFNYTLPAYVSMIDPSTYRFSAGSIKRSIPDISIFSGSLCDSTFEIHSIVPPTITLGTQVIGTIQDYGYQLYGYMEPFSYKENQLIEIASINQIEDGHAVLYIYAEQNSTNLFTLDIIIKKSKDHLMLALEEDSPISSFNNIRYAGLPIIQNGKLIGIFSFVNSSNPRTAYGYYAIDSYEEMINMTK